MSLEENNNVDTLLSQYFHSQRKEILAQRFLKIRQIQNTAKHISTESSTLWRVIHETLKVAQVDPKELTTLAEISDSEARYIVTEVQPEPFALSPNSIAQILITFNFSIKTLELLLKNAVLAQYSSKNSQRAVARSSEPLDDRERARTIQYGINALFIQIGNDVKSPLNGKETQLSEEDQATLSKYITAVISELKRSEAEYLLS